MRTAQAYKARGAGVRRCWSGRNGQVLKKVKFPKKSHFREPGSTIRGPHALMFAPHAFSGFLNGWIQNEGAALSVWSEDATEA